MNLQISNPEFPALKLIEHSDVALQELNDQLEKDNQELKVVQAWLLAYTISVDPLKKHDCSSFVNPIILAEEHLEADVAEVAIRRQSMQAVAGIANMLIEARIMTKERSKEFVLGTTIEVAPRLEEDRWATGETNAE